MAKRGGGTRDILTGGTHDVNPQWLFGPRMQNLTVGSFIAVTIPLPIQRLPQSGRAMVLELLKVMWDFDYTIINTDAATTLGGLAYLSTRPLIATPSTQDPYIIDWIEMKLQTLSATSGGIAVFQQHPYIHDLTDDAGHGILVGTDNLYVGLLNPTNYTSGNQCYSAVRILYRWKDVSLAEYVGMVQSQS